MAANISSLWTDKRTLSRSIPRWFVRVVGRGKRDFPPRFDWKKTFDSKRGFYFSRGLPSPCRGNNAVFLGARSIQPRFPDEGFAHDLFPLPWLNSKGREGEREKKKNSVIVQISRRNRKLLTKVFRTEEQSPLCLCPLSLEHCAPGY